MGQGPSIANPPAPVPYFNPNPQQPSTTTYADPYASSTSQKDIDMAEYQKFLTANNLDGLKILSARSSPPLDPEVKSLVDTAIARIEEEYRKRDAEKTQQQTQQQDAANQAKENQLKEEARKTFEADKTLFEKLKAEKNLKGLQELSRRTSPPLHPDLKKLIDEEIKKLEQAAKTDNTIIAPDAVKTAPQTSVTNVADSGVMSIAEMYAGGGSGVPTPFGVMGSMTPTTNYPSKFYPTNIGVDEVARYADSPIAPSMRPRKRQK